MCTEKSVMLEVSVKCHAMRFTNVSLQLTLAVDKDKQKQK